MKVDQKFDKKEVEIKVDVIIKRHAKVYDRLAEL